MQGVRRIASINLYAEEKKCFLFAYDAGYRVPIPFLFDYNLWVDVFLSLGVSVFFICGLMFFKFVSLCIDVLMIF